MRIGTKLTRTSVRKLAAGSFLAASIGSMGLASATPLLDVTVLGNTGSGYTSTLTGVTPGQTVDYEIVAQIAPTGSTNLNGYNGPPPFVVGTQTSIDGLNSLGFDLTDSSGATLSAPTLSSTFSQGTGASGGIANGSSVTQIFAITSPGAFYGGTSQTVLATGSFTAGSSALDTLSGTFDTTIGAAGFQFNDATAGQTLLPANDDTENLATATADGNLPFDPEIGFTPLTVQETSAVPEPASFGLVAIGSFMVLRRRRRVRA